MTRTTRTPTTPRALLDSAISSPQLQSTTFHSAPVCGILWACTQALAGAWSSGSLATHRDVGHGRRSGMTTKTTRGTAPAGRPVHLLTTGKE